MLPKIITDMLTGVDNSTYEITRVLSLLLVVVFLGLEIAAFVMGKPFDGASFGTGAGLTIAALAAGVKLTEPTT